ncbi:PaREP1 family protein [Thermogladius sp. 4427co]|uniref:PaREP1 family protein n=1 Tax=Thermogladius sp. 4427co TaxID=3450718 RepID=UPI003F7A0A35
MVATVFIPRRLYEEAVKKGIDVEDFVITMIAKTLQLDPQDVAGYRIELAEKLLEEAKSYIGKGDSLQASEKLYKAVEECIKALAELQGIPEYKEAVEAGWWKTGLLDRAVITLAKTLNEPRIVDSWDSAYYLHVQGFHENKFTVREVVERVGKIEWLVKYTGEVMKKSGEDS